LDVEGKNIVMNPKYRRQHNYQGYEKDYDLFHKRLDMNNEMFAQVVGDEIKNTVYVSEDLSKREDNTRKEVTDLEISSEIEDLIGVFNSIKNWSSDGMEESTYRYLLKEIANSLLNIQRLLPKLKTSEQLKKEQEKKNAELRQEVLNVKELEQFEDFDWNLEWDFDENESMEEDTLKSL